MKQHITKEQWEELNVSEKILWKIDKIGTIEEDESEQNIYKGLPNIGQLIEFLGDDVFEIKLNKNGRTWGLLLEKKNRGIYGTGGYRELCDALWEAVKYKLNEH